MKKRIHQLLFIALMTASVTVCKSGSSRAEVLPVNNEAETSISREGGWTKISAEDKETSDAAVAALEKAAGKLDGARYEAVAALAEQVVAGTNYMLLCKITPIVPDAEGSYYLVTVYEDLEGNVEITSAEDLIYAFDEQEANATAGKVIEPLQEITDISNISDGIFDVGFAEGRDVYSDTDGQTVIRMDVYEKVRFDAVDITLLSVGDMLRIDGEEITVNRIKETDAGIQINGDGAYTLVPSDGGTYVMVGASDHISRVKVGEVTLPIAENFQMSDSSDLEKAEQTISREEFIKKASESDEIYTPGDTTVRVENGYVVEMTHVYTP